MELFFIAGTILFFGIGVITGDGDFLLVAMIFLLTSRIVRLERKIDE